jgi:trans-aconitate methyltransferase
MSVFARQFGHPRGPLGRLVGLGMARGNADFSRWVVQQVLASREQPPERAVEVGSGPGVGLQELHKAFPHARLWGIDISSVMLAQAANLDLSPRAC